MNRAIACHILAATLSVSYGVADADTSEMATFIEEHCLKCHGPEEQEGDLRLDQLALPPASAEQWELVLEAIEYGDMPPKKEKRPDPAASENFSSTIKNMLRETAASGSPALRRMNRVEYENTLHDLLGVDTEIAEMLPEDGRSHGFDNVAGGLNLSAVLLEKYLEAANAAFDDVIRRFPPIPVETLRSVAMEDRNNVASVKGTKGGSMESKGAFVDFSPGWPPVRLDATQPKEAGIYRCRVAVFPHEPNGRTMAVEVLTGPLFNSDTERYHGVFDVTGTPEEPTVIEFTTRMEAKDAIHVLAQVFPSHVTYRDKHEKRPGVAVAWAETTGPLDQDFPSLTQKRLFGESPTITMKDDFPLYWKHRDKSLNFQVVDSTAPEKDVERIIREFVPRAMRGPVEKSVTDGYVSLALGRLAAGRSFEEAVRAGVTAVLCSPKFLLINYRPQVDDYAIASRMSYFLWSIHAGRQAAGSRLPGKAHERDGTPRGSRAHAQGSQGSPFREKFHRSVAGSARYQFHHPGQKVFPGIRQSPRQVPRPRNRGFFH